MFAKRLRAQRMKLGLTQQKMADILDLSLNAYQKYEQAERMPPYETLIRIADLFQVPTDYLLGRDAFLQVLGVSVDEYQ